LREEIVGDFEGNESGIYDHIFIKTLERRVDSAAIVPAMRSHPCSTL